MRSVRRSMRRRVGVDRFFEPIGPEAARIGAGRLEASAPVHAIFLM